MQLNKTTDYAVRIVMFLSQQNDIVTSEEISEATQVSKNYIMRILRKLSKAGLLKMVRGTKGGFQVAKPADEISLYDVIVIMEPTIQINPCLEDEEDCSLYAIGSCPVRRFYLSLQEELESKLKSTTIEKLKNSGGGVRYLDSS